MADELEQEQDAGLSGKSSEELAAELEALEQEDDNAEVVVAEEATETETEETEEADATEVETEEVKEEEDDYDPLIEIEEAEEKTEEEKELNPEGTGYTKDDVSFIQEVVKQTMGDNKTIDPIKFKQFQKKQELKEFLGTDKGSHFKPHEKRIQKLVDIMVERKSDFLTVEAMAYAAVGRSIAPSIAKQVTQANKKAKKTKTATSKSRKEKAGLKNFADMSAADFEKQVQAVKSGKSVDVIGM